MSQRELLSEMAALLDGAAIPYMVTGSIASSLQGVPRATHDIDLVVLLRGPASVDRLLAALARPDWFVDETAVRRAVDDQGMFNLIDTASGDKVDFWMLTDSPFDRSRFERAVTVTALNTHLRLSSPEDTILMKLRWAVESGGSRKQVLDATHVYELNRSLIDDAYLDRWARELDIVAGLAEVRAERGG
ncbi:MAG: hypothetical protein KDA25_10455 [Phycisphaerales bacterium]|nr:hypothetical protein [Phycisphaerales bacterium]